MASIKLASAIGEQRSPTSPFDGLDDALKGAGDSINRGINQRRNAEQRKRDVAFDDAMTAISTDIKALPNDEKTYKEEAARAAAEIKSMYLNGAKGAEIMLKKQEAYNRLSPMKQRFEKDLSDYISIAKFAEENKNKKDLTESEALLTGKYKTESSPMQNDDFFASSEATRAGEMPSEKGGMQATQRDVVDVKTTPYWEMTVEEREKIAPAGIYTSVIEKAKDITGNFNDASKGYFGKDYDPQKQYSKVFTTQNADGTAAQEVRLDTEEIARDKAKFLSSIGTDLGDVKTQQYWRTLANKAGAAGKKAGLYGDRLNKFIEESVMSQASLDFDNAVQQDIEKTKIAKVDNAPFREGKGLNINFTGGGGVSNGSTTLTKTDAPSPVIQEKYAKIIEDIDNQIKDLETGAGDKKKVENPKEFHARKIKTLQERKKIYENQLKNEPQTHIKYSSTKKRDDPFVSGYSDGERLVNFQLLDFVEKGDGWYMVGEKKSEEGTQPAEIPFTQSNYKKLIGEDPDSFKPMEIQGVKPMPEKKSDTKATAPKEVNIGFADYIKAYEKAKGKKASPEVIEKLKIKFQSK